MKCFKNINQILTLENAYQKDGRNLIPEDISIIENGAIVFDKNQILWIGRSKDLPKEYHSTQTQDLAGHVLTPELVDSHTHLVFSGNRSKEYTMRLNGADYETIAKAGGGILSSMKQTQQASEDELFDLGCERIERIAGFGVKTIEIKSGYALTYDGEKLLSKIIHKLKQKFAPKIQILNTYLAAHAVPKDYINSAEYLEKVVIPLLKDIHQHIDIVDIFHEQGYFSTEDVEILFNLSRDLGLKLKIHADEFNDNNGAFLAHQQGALSCDHLLKISQKGINALKNSNTVATVLPGTGLFLGKPLAPVESMLKEGLKVSIATDFNPGSCHCDNLLLLASISAPTFKMNIAQLWSAITLNASHSLGLIDQGVLIEGMKPRFSVFKCNTIDEITYNWGKNLYVDLRD
ncbi:MAG: imidazolonepropionase [Halobacteriovoraceae bacterium]|nr:imidazolonepropionase [Halobacteriovoraceae bacterium]